MVDSKNAQANLRQSQIVGSLMICAFIVVYLLWEISWQTTVGLFLLQGGYLVYVYFLNKRLGQVPGSHLSWLVGMVYVIPIIITYLQLPLEFAVLVWISILITLVCYRKYLNESQAILLFFMYHIFTSSDKVLYSIFGLILFGGIFILRLTNFTFLKNQEKEDAK